MVWHVVENTAKSNIVCELVNWALEMLATPDLLHGSTKNSRCGIYKTSRCYEDIHIVVLEGTRCTQRVASDEDQGRPREQAGEFPGLKMHALPEVDGEADCKEHREDYWRRLVWCVEPDGAIDYVDVSSWARKIKKAVMENMEKLWKGTKGGSNSYHICRLQP